MLKKRVRFKRFLIERLPLGRALIIIILSTLACSGTASLAVLYYWKTVWNRAADPDYQVTEIVHEVIDGDHLPQRYLQEQLGLSSDYPLSYYRFDAKDALGRLTVHGVLESHDVRCRFPNRMIVRYKMRKPIALVLDLPNTALDSSGMLFPHEPFYSKSQKLPYMRFGELLKSPDSPFWGSTLELPEVALGIDILALLKTGVFKPLEVLEIDMSHAFFESAGKRQIVISVKDLTDPPGGRPCIRTLRLSTAAYQDDLYRYVALRDQLRASGQLAGFIQNTECLVVDLRIPNLAYLQKL